MIRELSPSPLEQTVSGNDRVLVLGEVYLTEQKAKVQAIYLKNNSIRCKDASFYENRILIYTDPEIQVQIGNIIQVSGEADFFDTARNPGNFDQKLYYQRMDIHGLIWADCGCGKGREGKRVCCRRCVGFQAGVERDAGPLYGRTGRADACSHDAGRKIRHGSGD